MDWKKIDGFEDYYISSEGKVKSIKNKKELILKTFLIQGYESVNLVKTENGTEKRKSVRIHRLIAEYFIPKVENKLWINHKNGIKNDNRIENLEWCTPSENEKHSYYKLGKKSNGLLNRKLTKEQVLEIIELLKNNTHRKIAPLFNVSPSVIYSIKTKRAYSEFYS